MRSKFQQLWDSPTGLKTTHFWGPVANWGIVLAGLVDWNKPPDKISGNMTFALCVYSGLFMRFAWMVQPRNYLLLACHVSNEFVQLHHMRRKVEYEFFRKPEQSAAVIAPAAASPGAEVAPPLDTAVHQHDSASNIEADTPAEQSNAAEPEQTTERTTKKKKKTKQNKKTENTTNKEQAAPSQEGTQ